MRPSRIKSLSKKPARIASHPARVGRAARLCPACARSPGWAAASARRRNERKSRACRSSALKDANVAAEDCLGGDAGNSGFARHEKICLKIGEIKPGQEVASNGKMLYMPGNHGREREWASDQWPANVDARIPATLMSRAHRRSEMRGEEACHDGNRLQCTCGRRIKGNISASVSRRTAPERKP